MNTLNPFQTISLSGSRPHKKRHHPPKPPRPLPVTQFTFRRPRKPPTPQRILRPPDKLQKKQFRLPPRPRGDTDQSSSVRSIARSCLLPASSAPQSLQPHPSCPCRWVKEVGGYFGPGVACLTRPNYSGVSGLTQCSLFDPVFLL